MRVATVVLAVLATLSLGLVVAGCASEAPLKGGACPCVAGFVCCPDDFCVPENEMCAPEEELDEDHILWGVFMGFEACMGTIDWTSDDREDATWTTERGIQMIEKVNDKGGDGTIDERSHAVFDSDGRPLEVRWGPADPSRTWMNLTWAYDEMGRRLMFQFYVFQEEPDLPVQARLWRNLRAKVSYDGPRPVIEYDVDLDGVDEKHLVFQDQERRTERIEIDLPDAEGRFGGEVDEHVEVTREAHGIVRRQRWNRDRPDWLTTYTYDAELLHVIKIEDDMGADGIVDSSLVKEWDDRGRVRRRDFDFLTSGYGTFSVHYQYDCP